MLSNIENAEVLEIFRECSAGILVETNSVEALVNGLNALLKSVLNELGNKGREYVINKFDRRKQSEKLLGLIKLLNG